jgi:hypothetical protein
MAPAFEDYMSQYLYDSAARTNEILEENGYSRSKYAGAETFCDQDGDAVTCRARESSKNPATGMIESLTYEYNIESVNKTCYVGTLTTVTFDDGGVHTPEHDDRDNIHFCQ